MMNFNHDNGEYGDIFDYDDDYDDYSNYLPRSFISHPTTLKESISSS